MDQDSTDSDSDRDTGIGTGVIHVPTANEVFDMTGRVALVTGGSRGLGRQMVLAFARAGADVVIASRKLDACEKVAREVEELTGRRALPHACHLGRWDEIPDLVEAAYDRFGKVDVLVNNAGMSPLFDDLADISEKLYDATMSLNLKGPFRLAALVGPRMVGAGGGTIINVSTAGSLHPQPSFLVYAAAKAGLNALTEGLSKAYGPTVRVNTLMPGPYFTDISKAWDQDHIDTMFDDFALRRGGQPHEIIGAALFLASDASSFTTGAIVRSDGGHP